MNSQTTRDHKDVLSKPIVLELDSLLDSAKIAFVDTMILWIYELRKLETGREQFKHALVIEEAHHVLSHAKENAQGTETIMETCLRQIREFGEAVIVVDQDLRNSAIRLRRTRIAASRSISAMVKTSTIFQRPWLSPTRNGNTWTGSTWDMRL